MASIQCVITLKNGEEMVLSDGDFVNNSLSMKMSTCSGQTFDVGSFNTGVLQVKIYDDDALLHNFDGAEIVVNLVENDIEEGQEAAITALGIYIVDGSKTERQKNIISLTAQDYSVLFDVELEDNYRTISYTVYSLLRDACSICGVVMANDDNLDFWAEFPNSSVSVYLSSASIQTWRDAVMWAVQLSCANAVINRSGELEMRRAKYIAEDGAGSTIIADYESNGDDRVDVEYSDVRIYIRYLSAYSAGTVAEYDSEVDPSDEQARAGMLSLPDNPLLADKTKIECDTINGEWLEYIKTFAPRSIKAQMFFNPTLQLGSTVRFTGGKIDVRRSIIGVVTGITWKYHGLMTVICAAPQAVRS